MRADQLLVERGLAASRAQAQRLIAAGAEWQAVDGGWRRIAKSGEAIDLGAPLRLLDDAEARYASRGGLKLEGALRHTALDVRGCVCLDVGQSTGGFTDVLLQAGARWVVGVDVGHGQLHPRLRADARVQVFEGVNARSADALQKIANNVQSATAAGRFDLIVADLSFISLAAVLPALASVAAPGAPALLLVKPQFELGPAALGKGGIVRGTGAFGPMLERLCADAGAAGWIVVESFASAIAGGDGNREFFIHARRAP